VHTRYAMFLSGDTMLPAWIFWDKVSVRFMHAREC